MADFIGAVSGTPSSCHRLFHRMQNEAHSAADTMAATPNEAIIAMAPLSDSG